MILGLYLVEQIYIFCDVCMYVCGGGLILILFNKSAQ